MKTQNGFTLMKGSGEIREYLNSQKITRTINKLQIHHMDLPNYSTWENTDKRKWDEPHFGRTNSLNEYGKNTWDSRDEKGKYIAQHFNVFPDGGITSGRSLNSTPIGIRGWNNGAVCIEIYGDFDKGVDTMTSAQRTAVIELVGELCKRLDITPSENTMRYHAWFTSGGSYLGGYVPGESGKTCPGTNFFGGNTMAAYKQNFLPAIKSYLSNGSTGSTGSNDSKPSDDVITTNTVVRVTADELNIRQNPDANSAIVGCIKKGDAYTIVKTSGKWGYLKSGAGWIHLGYTEPVTVNTSTDNSFKVKITADVLNIRQNPDANSNKLGSVTEGDVYTIVKTDGDWGYLKSGAGWIHLGYTKRI